MTRFHPRARAGATAALGLWLGACVAETPRDPVPLVVLDDREAWVETDASDDPFLDHRPDVVGCPVATWLAETGSLELSTDLCAYISISQPSLVPLSAGDRVFIELFYFDLTAPEPTEGHWALAIGDEVIWERRPNIPGPGAVFEETLVIANDHPEGTLVTIHLHNHGQNTYNVRAVVRTDGS